MTTLDKISAALLLAAFIGGVAWDLHHATTTDSAMMARHYACLSHGCSTGD
jgi:hypothetical protein